MISRTKPISAQTTPYLFLDFSLNRERGEHKTVFEYGLEAQVENLPLDWDLEDLVRGLISGKGKVVHFSNPNFVRERKEKEKNGNRTATYNNIAIRIETDLEKDLVLVGDIYEITNREHRQFTVKAILTIDKNIDHYGEIEKRVDIVSMLDREYGWENPDGTYDKYLSDDQRRDNLFTDDFIVSLNRQYVVKDYRSVQDRFEKWQMFLDIQRNIIESKSKMGYHLESCKPEVITAYQTETVKREEMLEEIPFFKNSNKGAKWSLNKVNDHSNEFVLLHLYHEVSLKSFESSKRGGGDGMTRKILMRSAMARSCW